MSVSYLSDTIKRAISYRLELLDVDKSVPAYIKSSCRSDLAMMSQRVSQILRGDGTDAEKVAELQACIRNMNCGAIGLA